jgi:signal transduction histidine kinase
MPTPHGWSRCAANLANNAAKYTDEGVALAGVLQHAGSNDGSSAVVIKVRDTGMGHAAELLPTS